MIGFETDKLELVNIRSDWKVFAHRDFPFIKIDCKKRYKTSNGQINWKITVYNWNIRLDSPLYTEVFYKRFTANKIEEVFDKFIKINNFKYVIFQYLFNGKY